MPSPSSGVRPPVAVVGCGHWGKNLIRNFSELGALAAVSDTDRELAAGYAEQFNVPNLTFDDVLAHDQIQGVVLATPPVTHAGLALDAIAAGKDVFVEKPLALSKAEAEGVVLAAEEAGTILMVGHLLQYHPAFLRLKNLVEEGTLGRLQYIYSNRLNFGKIRRQENVFWSFAPHDISMILALVGESPDRVTSECASYLHPNIADVTTTHLAFRSGVNAHVFVSWLHPYKDQKLVVIGDRGMAVFNDLNPWDTKLVLHSHQVDWRDGIPEPNKADALAVPLEECEPLNLECKHFLDCITTRQIPQTDGHEGIRVLKVLTEADKADMISRSIS